jgi:tRNA(Phe) wybutosine-synthesizing methylase Tyw3
MSIKKLTLDQTTQTIESVYELKTMFKFGSIDEEIVVTLEKINNLQITVPTVVYSGAINIVPQKVETKPPPKRKLSRKELKRLNSKSYQKAFISGGYFNPNELVNNKTIIPIKSGFKCKDIPKPN